MIVKPVFAGLLLAATLCLPAAAADFTDTVARKMVARATSLAAAGQFEKGDGIRAALVGRQFYARVPGAAGILGLQFYATSYTVTAGTRSEVLDWKVTRNFFCFKPRDRKAYSCRHRLVKLPSGTVLVGRTAADGLAMKPRIKALQ